MKIAGCECTCKCGTTGVQFCDVHNDERALINEASDKMGAEWLLHLADELTSLGNIRVRLNSSGQITITAHTNYAAGLACKWAED